MYEGGLKMVVTLPKEICGNGNPKQAQEVKDIEKK